MVNQGLLYNGLEWNHCKFDDSDIFWKIQKFYYFRPKFGKGRFLEPFNKITIFMNYEN